MIELLVKTVTVTVTVTETVKVTVTATVTLTLTLTVKFVQKSRTLPKNLIQDIRLDMNMFFITGHYIEKDQKIQLINIGFFLDLQCTGVTHYTNPFRILFLC